jgi:hypothetical protein
MAGTTQASRPSTSPTSPEVLLNEWHVIFVASKVGREGALVNFGSSWSESICPNENLERRRINYASFTLHHLSGGTQDGSSATRNDSARSVARVTTSAVIAEVLGSATPIGLCGLATVLGSRVAGFWLATRAIKSGRSVRVKIPLVIDLTVGQEASAPKKENTDEL